MPCGTAMSPGAREYIAHDGIAYHAADRAKMRLLSGRPMAPIQHRCRRVLSAQTGVDRPHELRQLTMASASDRRRSAVRTVVASAATVLNRSSGTRSGHSQRPVQDPGVAQHPPQPALQTGDRHQVLRGPRILVRRRRETRQRRRGQRPPARSHAARSDPASTRSGRSPPTAPRSRPAAAGTTTSRPRSCPARRPASAGPAATR